MSGMAAKQSRVCVDSCGQCSRRRGRWWRRLVGLGALAAGFGTRRSFRLRRRRQRGRSCPGRTIGLLLADGMSDAMVANLADRRLHAALDAMAGAWAWVMEEVEAT